MGQRVPLSTRKHATAVNEVNVKAFASEINASNYPNCRLASCLMLSLLSPDDQLCLWDLILLSVSDLSPTIPSAF